jgi:uncharacterized LabA/DUF88 family protein
MNSQTKAPLIRVGVFYDGGYFYEVSKYYAFNHERRSWLQFRGLHEFVENEVAKREGVNQELCRVVDAHFFRGRFSAAESERTGHLKTDRVFDDILMWASVITHYRPLKPEGAKDREKGIDVWFALEAYEQAVLKRFDVLVLLTGDEDYVPLVKKVNTLGTKVMLLWWDFDYEYADAAGVLRRKETRTSRTLIDEVTYDLNMKNMIDDKSFAKDKFVNGLFQIS